MFPRLETSPWGSEIYDFFFKNVVILGNTSALSVNKTPCEISFFQKNAISDLYTMFKHDLDQNYDFKKLLGALVNPLSAKDVYTRFDPWKRL